MSSPEIMKRIVEAEKEGQKIVREAELEIARMKKDLPDRIASMRRETILEAAQQREQALKEAEKAGAEEAQRIALETRKQVEALSRIPEAKRKQALEKAMALLLSQSDGG